MKPFYPTRRAFLRNTGIAASASLFGARAQEATARLDKFGGLRARRFEATGFFRVEKRERWWFVTPEGHAWLGFGINHIHPAWLNQSYNRDFWLKRFGAATFNDDAWKAGLRARITADMAACGYNHFGVHNVFGPVSGLGFAELRPISFVKIPHYLPSTAPDYPDVFAPRFAQHCDELAAREVAPRRDDPWILGYAFTDCPIFTDAEAAARPSNIHGAPRVATPTWPRVLRNLPASAPGKQAWWAAIRGRYADDVNAFNDCYGVSFRTWDELLAAEHWRDLTDFANARELADNQAFLEQVVERYYATAVAAIRRHAPRHLIFGDKLNGNTDGGDAVVHVSARHTDVLLYQMYGRWPAQRAVLDRWRSRSDKPVFNGDGTFATTSEMMPNPYGPHARNQAERGEWAFEFGRDAFARPDFVGWSVCGWVDTWRTMADKGFKQHSGFFSPEGELHQPYVRRLREVSERLYEFARG